MKRAAAAVQALSQVALGARESPTSVVFVGGPLSGASRFASLLAPLSARGYNCFFMDLLRPYFGLCGNSLDDVIDAMHKGLSSARICSPPVAVAHFAEAVLMQKYLESFPVSLSETLAVRAMH